jgi:hypothetical protein
MISWAMLSLIEINKQQEEKRREREREREDEKRKPLWLFKWIV